MLPEFARVFLPRYVMHSVDYAVARCLSVRLSASVTRRYCVETAKHIVRFFSFVHHIG